MPISRARRTLVQTSTPRFPTRSTKTPADGPRSSTGRLKASTTRLTLALEWVRRSTSTTRA